MSSGNGMSNPWIPSPAAATFAVIPRCFGVGVGAGVEGGLRSDLRLGGHDRLGLSSTIRELYG